MVQRAVALDKVSGRDESTNALTHNMVSPVAQADAIGGSSSKKSNRTPWDAIADSAPAHDALISKPANAATEAVIQAALSDEIDGAQDSTGDVTFVDLPVPPIREAQKADMPLPKKSTTSIVSPVIQVCSRIDSSTMFLSRAISGPVQEHDFAIVNP